MSDSSTLDSITEEFIALLRRGERPSVEEYARRYSDLADDIRDLFPTVSVVEEAKARIRFGRASMGGGVSFGTLNVETLGDYQITREIGRGGMGIVYEAEQTSLDRRVAVKVLRSSALLDPKRAKRFELEAKAAAALHHTNIVPILGVGQQDGIHYLVMQLINGVSLDKLLSGEHAADITTAEQFAKQADTDEVNKQCDTQCDEPKPLPSLPEIQLERNDWQRISAMTEDVARALHYAHQHGVLHRDVKPGNLILDADDRVWVTDFGLAKQMGDEGVTASGDIVGTLRYMSPEQLEKSCDPRSDVYSLGLVLYELATRRPAFGATDHARVVQQIVNGGPARPRAVNQHIPRDLETIILKAIAKAPAHRYPTADALADDLSRFSHGQPIQARRVSVGERLWRWGRRNPAVAVPTILATLLLVAVAAVASVGYGIANREHRHAEQSLATANSERQRAEQSLVKVKQERQRAELSLRTAERERKRAESNFNTAARERERAEANLSLSLRVFEEVFDRIAPARLPPTEDDLMEDDPMDGGPAEPEAQFIVSPDDLALLESLLKFYDRFAQENGTSSRLQHEAARAHRRVGEIHQRLGNVEEARIAFERALELYERLADQLPVEHPDWTITAAVHNDLGMTLNMSGFPEEARTRHRQAREILLQQSAEIPHAEDVQLELVRTYNLLGYAIWGTSRQTLDRNTPKLITRAENNHREALKLLEQLISSDETNPSYRLMLARSYRDLSPVLFWRRRPDDAIQTTNKSLEILEQLVTRYPNTPEYRYELMRVYSQWDRRLWGDKGRQEGERRYTRAIALADQLQEDFPNVPEYSARAAYNRYKLGYALPWNSRRKDAERHLRSAIELQQIQLTRYPNLAQHHLHLAKTRKMLAKLHLKFEEFGAARALLDQSIKDSEKAPTGQLSGASQRYARELFAQQYYTLAKTLKGLGEDEQASEAVRHAKQLQGKCRCRDKASRPDDDPAKSPATSQQEQGGRSKARPT